jgi:signal transduction histidine kinase
MSRTIQTRVLVLVGAGVFIAAAAVALLSRATLLTLEHEASDQYSVVGTLVADRVGSAITDDMRLLAGIAGVSGSEAPAALESILHFGRIASSAALVGPDGTVTFCTPVADCAALRSPDASRGALEAMRSQRPVVSAMSASGRVFAVLPFQPITGGTEGAAMLAVDIRDRRFEDLLRTSGHLVADIEGWTEPRPRTDARVVARVSVPHTPLALRLSSTAGDPLASVASFRRRSLWFAPIAAVIAMLLGWGMAESVRRPLVTLTSAAEAISAGNLEEHIDPARALAGGRDIARLAAALERMREALKASIDELETRVRHRTSELAAVNARLEDRERARQRLLRTVITAQEQERKRIARELHDETSQTLAALGIGVDLAAASEPSRLGARLSDVRRLVDRMHGEIHRLIMDLRPSVLDDLGLAAAIRWCADRHLTEKQIAVRCEFDDTGLRLAPEAETALFRAVQESIVNIARHAGADSVLIQGACTADHAVTVEIEDDGDGFVLDGVSEPIDSMRGIGLLGMRERIEMFGGTLSIESSPGAGTRVMMSMPTEASQ